MDLDLKGHVALVVGGASGIGLATAQAFASEGANLVVWDCNPTAPAFAEQISQEFGTNSLGLVVDVTNYQAVMQAMKQTTDRFPAIHHLVHAAAIGSGKFGFPFTNLQPADWLPVLNVNIMGMTHIAQAVAPHMVAAKTGTMVFIASVAGQIGSQTDPPYSASKAANINFAQCLAKDLAPHGVRVNTICPGMVRTPLNRSVWQAWHNQTPPDQQLPYETWADQKIQALVPLGTWQTPQSIADMVLFLSSERASQVTGQTLNVDGGFVMHW